jgi:Fe-S-cluster containining protein
VLDFLSVLFNSRGRMPRDKRTKIPRSARKAAQPHLENVKKAIDGLAGLPGIADVSKTQMVPKGFYGLMDGLLEHYDQYAATLRKHMDLGEAARPGSPGGCGACFAAPMGVHGIEALNIYREVRPWNDFPQIGNRCAKLGERQIELMQEGHKGDPEKIRMTSKAAQRGLQKFAELGEPCPFLDVGKQRCRIWEKRPISCRMHHITSDPEWTDPRHDHHDQIQVKNLRLPIKQQATVTQLEKRMELGLSPFLYASVLQLVHLNEGELIQEVGAAPQRMGQDGRVVQKANRNKKGAKKYQKGKKGKGKKRK